MSKTDDIDAAWERECRRIDRANRLYGYVAVTFSVLLTLAYLTFAVWREATIWGVAP